MRTSAAKAAAEIRAILRKAFPAVKFHVTSSNYSMGDSVSVSYCDGVTTDKVGALIGRYEYGTFDGTDDSYHYDNVREDIPQTRHLFIDRDYSDAVRAKTAKELAAELQVDFADEPAVFMATGDYPDAAVRRKLSAIDL